jgi:hypothetical protein
VETIGLGVTYLHPEHGVREVKLSAHTRSILEVAYAQEPLRAALHQRGGITAQPIQDMVAWLRQRRNGWVLGCSGFASVMANDNYGSDRAVLARLYEYMKHNNVLPVFTSDGGTGTGALQANAEIADQFDVPTLGCTPISALAKDHIGPRRRTIIGGANYEGREKLVGALPDILLCIDGKDGTLREAEEAAGQGSIVALVSLRSYQGGPIDTHMKMPNLRRAVADGQAYYLPT